MTRIRHEIWKAIRAAQQSGRLERREAAKYRARLVCMGPRQMAELENFVMDCAVEDGVLPPGEINWEAIPWDKIAEFIQKIFDMILAFINGLSRGPTEDDLR